LVLSSATFHAVSVPANSTAACGRLSSSMGLSAFRSMPQFVWTQESPAEVPLLRNAAPTTEMQPGAMPRVVFQDDADMPRDVLGRLVFSVLHTMLPGHQDDLHAPRAAALVRQLRQRVTCALCCTVLTVPVAMWSLLRGMAAYLATDNSACSGPFRLWLLGFLMLQLSWPVCIPWMGLLLLAWCLGALLLLRENHRYRHCSQMQDFLLEAFVLQSLQALMLITAAVAALTARPLVRQLGELLSHGGTDPEVVRGLLVLQSSLVPANEECVICLSREDEEGLLWRELSCGHRFHEPCLLQWLAKARRCPVCRLDLHRAYIGAAAGAPNALRSRL